jgi:hypothetical protein
LVDSTAPPGCCFARFTVAKTIDSPTVPVWLFIIAAIYRGLGSAAVFLSVADAYLLLIELYVVLGPRTTGRSLESVSPGTTPIGAVR